MQRRSALENGTYRKNGDLECMMRLGEERKVAVLDQNVLMEDRVEERRVGVGEGNFFSGRREENPHSWVQPYGWIISIFQSRLNISIPRGLVGDIMQGLEEVNLRQYAAVVIIAGGNDIVSKDGTFRRPLRFLIDDLITLKSYVVSKTMGQVLLCSTLPRLAPTSKSMYVGASCPLWTFHMYQSYNKNVILVNKRITPDVYFKDLWARKYAKGVYFANECVHLNLDGKSTWVSCIEEVLFSIRF